MVVAHDFQDILDVCSKTCALSLPAFKQNPLKITFENCVGSEVVYDGPEPVLPFAQSGVFKACIANWRLLTMSHEDCKSVYEVTFNIAGSNFTYKPGDTIGIIPHNLSSEVDFIINHLGLSSQADVTYGLSVDTSLKGAKIPPHVPVKSTLKYALTHCVDIRSVVKKLFILALSKHTKDETEKSVLEYLCSKEGSSIYTTHILKKNLCVLDLFRIFKSCKPPVEVILANLPRLLPRSYSIANSGLKDMNILKICFSVIDLGNTRKGLTTGWLEFLIENSSIENRLQKLSIINGNSRSCDYKVPIYLRKNISGFLMPDDLETPLILLGPGTGVAPYIGFLEERESIKKNNPEVNFGNTWLFFGCRNPKLDFIYEEEIKDFVLNGTLNKINTAFSRVDGEIKYIQDALFQNGEEVVKLLRNGASIFVCGDYKIMAAQVKETLERCLIKYGESSQEEAGKFLSDLVKEKRYVVDIWT